MNTVAADFHLHAPPVREAPVRIPNPDIAAAYLIDEMRFKCPHCGARHERTVLMYEHRDRYFLFRCHAKCGQLMRVRPDR